MKLFTRKGSLRHCELKSDAIFRYLQDANLQSSLILKCRHFEFIIVAIKGRFID